MGLRNSKKKKTPAEKEAAAKAAVDKADATYAKKLATLGKPGTRFTSDNHFRKQQRQSLDRGREAQMGQTVKRFKAKTADDAAYAPHAAAWSGGRRRRRRRRKTRRGRRKTRRRRRKTRRRRRKTCHRRKSRRRRRKSRRRR